MTIVTMTSSLNTRLKVAIVSSGRKQKRIAHLAHIDETQLSHIVRGRRLATPAQQQRLARVLGSAVERLFPVSCHAATAPAEPPGVQDETSSQWRQGEYDDVLKKEGP